MKRAAVLLALVAGGCVPAAEPTPEELALEVYEVAEEAFAARRYADAAPDYEFVIAARDRWKDPYVKLSRCYDALGRPDDAVAILKRLLTVDRFDEEGLRELARLEARRKP